MKALKKIDQLKPGLKYHVHIIQDEYEIKFNAQLIQVFDENGVIPVEDEQLILLFNNNLTIQYEKSWENIAGEIHENIIICEII